MGRQTSEPTVRILPITQTPYVVYYQPPSNVVVILTVLRRRGIAASPIGSENLSNIVELPLDSGGDPQNGEMGDA